jgi:hypothetical protein
MNIKELFFKFAALMFFLTFSCGVFAQTMRYLTYYPAPLVYHSSLNANNAILGARDGAVINFGNSVTISNLTANLVELWNLKDFKGTIQVGNYTGNSGMISSINRNIAVGSIAPPSPFISLSLNASKNIYLEDIMWKNSHSLSLRNLALSCKSIRTMRLILDGDNTPRYYVVCCSGTGIC